MSIRMINWVFGQAATTNGTDQLVLLAIADHSNDQGREARPATATLAKKTRLTRRCVIDALKRLEATNVLTIHRGRGRRGTHLYEIRVEGTAPCEAPSAANVEHVRRAFTAECDAHSHDPSCTFCTPVLLSNGGAPNNESSPNTLEFPTRDGRGWVLASDELAAWRLDYPSLNVLEECRRARAWLNANPTKRKAASNMPRFLVAWLNRSQRGTGPRRHAGRRTVCNLDALTKFASRGEVCD